MKHFKPYIIIAVLGVGVITAGMFSGVGVRTARALGLDSMLQAGGVIAWCANGGQALETGFERALGRRTPREASASKIVPIISAGNDANIGIAQVVGPAEDVRQVQGVAAVKTTIGGLPGLDMIPVSTTTPGASPSRIDNVGVAAIIDYEG